MCVFIKIEELKFDENYLFSSTEIVCVCVFFNFIKSLFVKILKKWFLRVCLNTLRVNVSWREGGLDIRHLKFTSRIYNIFNKKK